MTNPRKLLALALIFPAFAACARGSEPHTAAPDAGRIPDAQVVERADAGGSGGRPAASADAGRAQARDAGVVATHADSGSDSDAGPLPVRPKLATSGTQLLVQGARVGFQLTEANLRDDADVYAMHQEFYGIPWQAFQSASAPPAEWVALMQELAAGASRAGKPVFLSVNMLNGIRERLAATTKIEDGQVKTTDDTSPKCYDFATAADSDVRRGAYLRYLDFMLDTFEPQFLNLAIEVNLFFEKCPDARVGLIEVINQAYQHVKARRPKLLVFPSFQIEHLYGYSKDTCPDQDHRDLCFDKRYAEIQGIMRDRFAMSSYPFMDGATPAGLPPDYFERGAKRGNERPLIAETGWPTSPLIARLSDGSCLTVFSYTESDSAAYVARLLDDAKRLNMDLVTWWSDRDLVTSELMTQCPCSFDATWCAVLDVFRGQPVVGQPESQFYGEVLLKAFGSMGLRDYTGTPRKAHLTRWNASR